MINVYSKLLIGGENTKRRMITAGVQIQMMKNLKCFFEELLNIPDVTNLDLDANAFTTPVTIPLLDSEISVVEVENSITKLKIDKASGPDGLCPGIFKVLPVQWLLSITTLFNSIFTLGCYPSSWRLARLLTTFKLGDPYPG